LHAGRSAWRDGNQCCAEPRRCRERDRLNKPLYLLYGGGLPDPLLPDAGDLLFLFDPVQCGDRRNPDVYGLLHISGGIQIMMSRNVDNRMTYVIGFSMLLGLGRDVFQNYFKRLPGFLHPFTSSMMPIAVISALILHLIFRLGSRRKANVAFEKV
ncbi:unnamed protein product, partial [Discosporangium mesarthrocarpum]